MPENSVQTCVTSPPYWGLRDYGHDGQIGLESTPEAYVERMVEVFREVRRVLRDDGTLWLNLGDSYAGYWGDSKAREEGRHSSADTNGWTNGFNMNARPSFDQFRSSGIKPKDLVGIPWRVALALQADGWWLRQDIIWHKPNPMPESITDRCTKAHEYIFLLAKSARYFYDAEAIKQVAKSSSEGIRFGGSKYGDSSDPKHATKSGSVSKEYATANRRSVWTITTKSYRGAHFATFPEALVEPMILAGSPEDGLVLDPFTGSGTTGAVALRLGRNFVGCELNPEYVKLAESRLRGEAPPVLESEESEESDDSVFDLFGES
jgi:DNA modification methylase